MNILMLSWRDILNPNKGGAEVYTFEVLKRLANKGHKITWLAAGWPGCKKNEIYNKIKFIRVGSFFTVYLEAYKYYKKQGTGNFDLVIDQINTIPFFTPLYVKESHISLIFQLAREVWFSETKFPLNVIGYLLEPIYLRLYNKTKMITISKSTKIDLNNLGINNISIIPVGLSFKPLLSVPRKEKNFTLIYVGRLKKSKRVHDVIKAVYLLKDDKVKLWIVGTGDYENKLKALVSKLGLTKQVNFYGYVDEKKKGYLMSRAHTICVTSKREGWGMIITEANALGTPAVVYNSPGLRDAVKNGYNGFITSKNDSFNLSKCIYKLFSDKKIYNKLCNNCLNYAKGFNWDKTTNQFERVLKNERK